MDLKTKLKELKPTDLNCNVFDVYSYNGLSMQELLCQFFTKINECIEVSNNTIELAEWLVNEGLKKEVANKLILWYNDGSLEELINVTLFENLNKKIDRVESKIIITPDDFEGSDIEKVQKALDYSIENNVKTIQLNRTYDLTGGTIFYNGGYSQPPTFKDGELIKLDKGYMFSRLEDNNNSNSPLFFNVSFKGDSKEVCYVFDGDKMIRQNFKNCNFKYIALIKTSGYIQSLRMDNCEMSFSSDVFISCSECYDVNITNNRFEESHKTLIKCYSDSTTTFSNNAMRITNNLIEGYTKETPIVLSSAYGLIIANNYFEYNKGDIEFVKSEGINNVNASINNNSFFRSLADWHIKANGNNVSKLYLDGNSTTMKKEDNKSFTVGLNYENITNTYLNSGGRLVPKDTIYPSNGVKYTFFNNGGKSAIRITPRTSKISSTLDLLGRSYLIHFTGTFGSSIYYRATFTGILSVGGNWDSSNSVVCRELTINKLTSTNMNGVTGNNVLWDTSYVTAVFESTNTNKIGSVTDDNIIITFNNIPYNETYNRACVSNLDCILTSSLYMERNVQD